MPDPVEPPRYRFGPLERRGLLLGLTAGQVLTLGVAALGVMLALRAASPGPGAGLALFILGAAVAGAFASVSGRPLVAWLPMLASYGQRRITGRHRWESGTHLIGHTVLTYEAGGVIEALPPEERPESMRGLVFVEALAGRDEVPVGVIKCPTAHTYVGVLRAHGRSLGLLDEAGQTAALQGWASILNGYVVRSSPIARLQWIERCLPDDGEAIARHFSEGAAPDAPEAARRVYGQAIDQAREAGSRHECLLAVCVDARRAWRQVRQAGGGDVDRGACALLLRELLALAERLEAIDIEARAALSSRELAEVMRSSFEPAARRRLRVIHGTEGGPHPRNAWPQATTEHLAEYQTGGCWHATYHVREWPRVEVGPGFLGPLLLDGHAPRVVAMVMEPIPTERAERELRQAQANDASDDTLRQKAGWLTSFRRMREEENVHRAEQELADGHASYRFSGYVTVSGDGVDELEAACADVEQAASRSHLELERLVAQQELAFTYTLPLCHGLA